MRARWGRGVSVDQGVNLEDRVYAAEAGLSRGRPECGRIYCACKDRKECGCGCWCRFRCGCWCAGVCGEGG